MRTLDLKALVTCATVIACFFAAGSWWISQSEFPDPSKRPVLAWQPKQVSSTDSIPIEKVELIEALKRPLFRVSRKPFDPTQAVQAAITVPQLLSPAQPAPPQPVAAPVVPTPAIVIPASSPPVVPQFVLKGLSDIDGKRRALVAIPEKPEGQWLLLGEDVAGWKLQTMDSNTVHLKLDQQTVTLSLYVDNAAKSVGSP
jgi:hypothetical protein